MRTATQTTTATRLQLLQANLRVATCRLHCDPERVIRKVLDPCMRVKLLKRLEFLGLDEREMIQAQLSLTVDWSEHEHLAIVNSRLRVEGRVIQKGAPELQALLDSFEEVVADKRLRIATVLHLCRREDTAEFRRLLGLRDAPRRQWTGTPAETSFPLRNLREMTISLALADNEMQGT